MHLFFQKPIVFQLTLHTHRTTHTEIYANISTGNIIIKVDRHNVITRMATKSTADVTEIEKPW